MTFRTLSHFPCPANLLELVTALYGPSARKVWKTITTTYPATKAHSYYPSDTRIVQPWKAVVFGGLRRLSDVLITKAIKEEFLQIQFHDLHSLSRSYGFEHSTTSSFPCSQKKKTLFFFTQFFKIFKYSRHTILY